MKIEIDVDFHDYRNGCPFIQVVRPGLLFDWETDLSCENSQLCQQLWRRLSTIQNDPPDLMGQIAAICREKGIPVEEAVELFRKF